MTRDINTLEELFILLTQWENMRSDAWNDEHRTSIGGRKYRLDVVTALIKKFEYTNEQKLWENTS